VKNPDPCGPGHSLEQELCIISGTEVMYFIIYNVKKIMLDYMPRLKYQQGLELQHVAWFHTQ